LNFTETDIIAACQEQKREAQKALFKMHYSFAMGICMRYANSKEEAQEIMNDGFMKMFQYIKKFDLKRPFRPWLKQVLVNCAVDHFRKNLKHRNQVELEEGIDEVTIESALDDITYNEMLDLVRKLPPAYRTVFNLHAIEGFKHEEIARMLNISEGTSKSNYARAKEKLQKHLNAYFEVGS
jgi:RNA polymerase sigma-70 factor (ECF subfamily)